MWVCGGCFAASETWKATSGKSWVWWVFFRPPSLGHFSTPKNPMIVGGGYMGNWSCQNGWCWSRGLERWKLPPLWFREGSEAVRAGNREAPFSGVGRPDSFQLPTGQLGGWTPRYSQLWKLGNFSKPPTWKEGISARVIYRLESMIPSLSSACSQCIPFYNISFYDSTYTYVQGVYVYIYI